MRTPYIAVKGIIELMEGTKRVVVPSRRGVNLDVELRNCEVALIAKSIHLAQHRSFVPLDVDLDRIEMPWR